MPRIEEFTSPVKGLQPQEGGINALREAGFMDVRLARETGEAIGGAIRGIGQVGDQIAQRVDQHNAMMEISTGAVTNAKTDAALQQNYSDYLASADPNDHSAPQRYFDEQVVPTLQKQMDGYHTETGQRFGVEQFTKTAQSWQRQVSADTMRRVGDAAVKNWQDTTNTDTTSIYNNPSLLPAKLGMLEHVADGVGSGLTPEQASEFKRKQVPEMRAQYVTSAVIGTAYHDPNAARKLLDDPAYQNDLDIKARLALTNKVNDIEKGIQAQQTADEKRQKGIQKQNFSTAVADLESTVQYTPDGKATYPSDFFKKAQMVNQMPNADHPTMQALIGKAQRDLKGGSEGIKTAPGLEHQLISNLTLPDGDPNKTTPATIYKHAGVDLSNTDAKFILGIANPKTPQEIGHAQMLHDAVQRGTSMLIGNADPFNAVNAAKTQRFTSWFYKQIQDGVAQGKSINSMVTQGDPNFLLTPENLYPFTKTTGNDVIPPNYNPAPGQAGKVVGGAIPAPTPAKPKLSPAEFLQKLHDQEKQAK